MIDDIWKPLNGEKREIRLIAIEPNDDVEAKPICSLRIVSLDEQPEYQAISYAWGDPMITRPIYVDGVELQVTENLEAGLRHVRYHHEDQIVLWVDSICICQADTQEKNHQVQLMKTIFGSAVRVLVWLGDENPGTYKALTLLEGLAGWDNPDGEITQLVDLYDASSGQRLDDSDLEAVASFLSLRWWHRVWVQQEYILANAHQIIQGEWDIKFIDLYRVGFLHGQGLLDIYTKDTLQQFSKKALDQFSQSLETLRHMHEMVHYQDLEYPDLAADNFIFTLATGRFFQASNTHDSLYGLLGLAPDTIAAEIVPEYDLPLETVRWRTAITLLKHSESLLLLSLTPPIRSNQDIPSWVPDWSSLGSNQHLRDFWSTQIERLEERRGYSASGNRGVKLDFHDDRTLRISALQVDHVITVSTEIWGSAEDSQCLKEWQRFYYVGDRRSRHITGGTREDAFWRTLVNDRHHKRDCSQKVESCSQDCEYVTGARDLYQKWAKEVFEPLPFSGDDVRMFDMNVKIGCVGRRLFITKRGHLGVGPASLECADAIYILAGGHHPYVLRQTEKTDPARVSASGLRDSCSDICLAPQTPTGPSLSFQLIGDCYVHGLMYGEAVSGRPKYRSAKDLMRKLFFGGQGPDSTLAKRKFKDIYIV